MFLVVGLGNPGRKYAATRHNLGFRIVECLAQRWHLAFNTSDPDYRLATGKYQGQSVTLLQPLTYMNLSGQAITAWSRASGYTVVDSSQPATGDCPGDDSSVGDLCSVERARLIVVCDDLALPLGALRIRAKGSAGGQKGLASILEAIGSEMIPRVRLGVAGADCTIEPEDWADYVLSEFSPDEFKSVETVITYAADAIECLLSSGIETAVSRFNCRQILDSALPDED